MITDLLQIQEVVYRLHRALDDHDYAALVACFDEEGVWVRQGRHLTGRDAIAAAMRERSTTLVSSHHLSNPIITLDGDDSARADYYLTVYLHDEGTPARLPLARAGACQAGRASAALHRNDQGWRVVSLETAVPTFKLALG